MGGDEAESQKRTPALCFPNANFADFICEGNDVNFLASFIVPAMALI